MFLIFGLFALVGFAKNDIINVIAIGRKCGRQAGDYEVSLLNSSSITPGTSIVLLYHRIGPIKLSSHVTGQYVSPRVLCWGLDELCRAGWRPVSLDQCIDASTKCRVVNTSNFAITFDDGYLSVYDHACPALNERGLTATIYLVVDALGGVNEWDKRAGDVEERMMSAAQARELAENGFEIGSHTLTHPRLTQLDDETLTRELDDSKRKLEDMIGREVTSFSYPYGDFDNRVLKAAVGAGYKNAVCTGFGAVVHGTGLFEIPRINMRWNGFGMRLRRKIQRAIKATCCNK